MSGSSSLGLVVVLLFVTLAAMCGCRGGEGPRAQPDSETPAPANGREGADSIQPQEAEENLAIEAETDAQPQPVRRFRLPESQPDLWEIEAVEADGTVRLAPIENELPRWEPGPEGAVTEGYYLGLAFAVLFLNPNAETWAESYYSGIQSTELEANDFPDNAGLFRINITEVADDGTASGEVGAHAAERLELKTVMLLVRPPNASTSQLEAVPEFAPLKSFDGPGEVTHENASRRNLSQIGIALLSFHDTFGHFPPAVIRGPDGEPWHSWRVLMLPFIDQMPLYEQYRFDEPWDGPNNKKLLEQIPAFYQDPVYGETEQPYTHYAAIVGPGGDALPPDVQTVFSVEGARFEDLDNPLLSALSRTQGSRPEGVSTQADIGDSSQTILVGTVDPEREIPWTKPEDVEFHDQFPPPGGKDGFAAPHRHGNEPVGIFLFGDGLTWAISARTDVHVFRQLMTRTGGEGLLPESDPRRLPHGGWAYFLDIEPTDEGPVAWFKEEWSGVE